MGQDNKFSRISSYLMPVSWSSLGHSSWMSSERNKEVGKTGHRLEHWRWRSKKRYEVNRQWCKSWFKCQQTPILSRQANNICWKQWRKTQWGIALHMTSISDQRNSHQGSWRCILPKLGYCRCKFGWGYRRSSNQGKFLRKIPKEYLRNKRA